MTDKECDDAVDRMVYSTKPHHLVFFVVGLGLGILFFFVVFLIGVGQ